MYRQLFAAFTVLMLSAGGAAVGLPARAASTEPVNQRGWELSAEGWAGRGRSRVRHDLFTAHKGRGSLQITATGARRRGIQLSARGQRLESTLVGDPTDVLTAQVYLPSNAGGKGWAARLEARNSSGWKRGPRVSLTPGQWSEVRLVLGRKLATGIQRVGVKVKGDRAGRKVKVNVDTLRLEGDTRAEDGAEAPPRMFGTLQSDPNRLPQVTAAGVNLVTVSAYWSRFEPVEGRIDHEYVAELRKVLARFRDAGAEIVLSTGVHHPPAWLLDEPNSRYVNQYGDVYAPSEPGKRIANMVFNQAMREKQQAYLGRLFAAVGTDFYGVRLGGGWYGELNYPDHNYNHRSNAYWSFDPIASGSASGLPVGMETNPVPGWAPGQPAPRGEASKFAEWYLESLRNYHDWQITTVRRLYGGKLLMMYPSWGIRPGDLPAAVAGNLSGHTSAERNGEVQRGFDFARFIRGVRDPGVVVYTTWLNADSSADSSSDARYWSPVKFLAHVARDRVQPLAVMGENTGRDTELDMAATFEQARRHGLIGVVWAFESELFAGSYASIADYARHIRLDRGTVAH